MASSSQLSIIILAAGQGTRMRSDLPKVLHSLAGKTLLEHVHTAAARLEHNGIYIVYGYGGRKVPDTLPHLTVNWLEQKEQLGTGHAVQQAIDNIPDGDQVLILYGDIPLITCETLKRLVEESKATGFSLMTCRLEDPSGYGRIVRDATGEIASIVEEKDADEEQLTIREINTGMMTVNAANLKKWLNALDNDNKQGEYYLTDIIAMAAGESVVIRAVEPESITEISGINNRVQLAEIERYYQLVQARHLMLSGVTLMDPSRFDLRGDLITGHDVIIDVNVIIEGSVSIGHNVTIGQNCHINNADIGSNAAILPNTIIEDAVVGDHCRIGPFSRVRPGTRLADNVHVGNFVELKNAQVDSNSKINHLSYVGDSEIGRDVNIGAGTITCNYDGANKHRTVIGDNVHIGSDTQLIAPVTIGEGATIGAGTTVTKDVEAGDMVHNKTERKIIKDWERPKKDK